eukprot:6175687-Pleurochrysis_carterae.AAC.1
MTSRPTPPHSLEIALYLSSSDDKGDRGTILTTSLTEASLGGHTPSPCTHSCRPAASHALDALQMYASSDESGAGSEATFFGRRGPPRPLLSPRFPHCSLCRIGCAASSCPSRRSPPAGMMGHAFRTLFACLLSTPSYPATFCRWRPPPGPCM